MINKEGVKLDHCREEFRQAISEGLMVTSSSSSSLDSEVRGHDDQSKNEKNSLTIASNIECSEPGDTTEASKDIAHLASSLEEIPYSSSLTALVQFTLPLNTLSQLAAEAVIENDNSANKNTSETSSASKKDIYAPISTESNSLSILSSEEINLKRKMTPSPNYALLQHCIPIQRPRSGSFDSSSNSLSPLHANVSNLRRGKWTAEEEAYVARVIRDFNYGYLDAPAGTTLRTYLSAKLHCDPMRITKKFTGDSCIGKRVFHPAVRCVNNSEAIDKAQAELWQLEKRWRMRLEIQQREASKKTNALSITSIPIKTSRSLPDISSDILSTKYSSITTNSDTQHSLERTATWLDRANSLLANRPYESNALDFERQINEIKQLIHEGPNIQKTSAGIPKLLELKIKPNEGKSSKHASADFDVTNTIVHDESNEGVSEHASDGSPPSKKRCQSFTVNASPPKSGVEEVEALVGFLNSVRREAAPQEQP